MAAAAIIENRKIAISQQRFDGLQRNLVRVHIFSPSNVLTVKFEFIKIQDGGRLPSSN